MIPKWQDSEMVLFLKMTKCSVSQKIAPKNASVETIEVVGFGMPNCANLTPVCADLTPLCANLTPLCADLTLGCANPNLKLAVAEEIVLEDRWEDGHSQLNEMLAGVDLIQSVAIDDGAEARNAAALPISA